MIGKKLDKPMRNQINDIGFVAGGIENRSGFAFVPALLAAYGTEKPSFPGSRFH